MSRKLSVLSISIFILTKVFCFGQSHSDIQFNGEKLIYYWGIDKLTLKEDSLELIRNKVSKIKVYEHSKIDSSKWKTQLIGTWTIEQENGLIKTSSFIGKYETLPKLSDKLNKHKNTIIESIGTKGSKFKLIHYINSSGQIFKTNIKCLECKFESRFNMFDYVEYKYNNGLLIESDYFGNGRFIEKRDNYLKYTFEYEK